MDLENQVTSLELSKRLKELGVKQESLFWWWQDYYGVGAKEPFLKDHEPHNPKGGWKYCSAFTVAELGEMLKDAPHPANPNFAAPLPEWSDKNGWSNEYVYALTEADARAKMLIYLIENKLTS